MIHAIKTASSGPQAKLLLVGLFAVLLYLQQMLELPGRSSLHQAMHNAAHTPLFMLLGLLMWYLTASLQASLRQKFILFTVSMAIIAALTEIAQKFTGRDASLQDWIRDMLGVGAAAALIAACTLPGLKALHRLGLGTACGLCVVAGFVSVFQVLEKRQLQLAMAPDLLALDEDLLLRTSRIKGDWSIVSQPAKEGDARALLLKFGQTGFPGITLREPAGNWDEYRWLLLDVESVDDAGYPLLIRVETWSDKGMDRLVELRPGSRRTMFRVPLTQLLEEPGVQSDNIRNLLVYTGHEGRGKSILLHAIRLQ